MEDSFKGSVCRFGAEQCLCVRRAGISWVSCREDLTSPSLFTSPQVQRLGRKRRWRVEQRPPNQMGHVGLTCPCLRHPCTLSLVPRSTLTATLRKTTEEGKTRSYLINLGPPEEMHTNTKAHVGRGKHMETQRSHYSAPVARLCVCWCVFFFSRSKRLVKSFSSYNASTDLQLPIFLI